MNEDSAGDLRRHPAEIYADLVLPILQERLVVNFDYLVEQEVVERRYACESQAQRGILGVLFPADPRAINLTVSRRADRVALEEAAVVLRKWQEAGEPLAEICRRVRLNQADGSPWRQAAQIMETQRNMTLAIESSASSPQATLDQPPRPSPPSPPSPPSQPLRRRLSV